MSGYTGRYHKQKADNKKYVSFFWIPLSFLLIELFGLGFLLPEGEKGTFPLAFGLLWSGTISGVLFLLPTMAARILYGILYFLSAVYAGFQTGYYLLFSGMLWLSDFRYAAEGSDYADILLTHPVFWWLGIFGMILLGIFLLWKFPRCRKNRKSWLHLFCWFWPLPAEWIFCRNYSMWMMTRFSMPVRIMAVPSLPRQFMRICSIRTVSIASAACIIRWPRISIKTPSIL